MRSTVAFAWVLKIVEGKFQPQGTNVFYERGKIHV